MPDNEKCAWSIVSSKEKETEAVANIVFYYHIFRKAVNLHRIKTFEPSFLVTPIACGILVVPWLGIELEPSAVKRFLSCMKMMEMFLVWKLVKYLAKINWFYVYTSIFKSFILGFFFCCLLKQCEIISV